jgi:predicted enzyme related to lactoylglutathione lyase
MPRVIHFEIPTDNPELAVTFYREVFGWTLRRWEGAQEYWLVTTGEPGEPGIDGGLMRRPTGTGGGTINTIAVPSVSAFIERIERHGGAVVVPKLGIPGVGWLAYCRDPDGNVFGILESADDAS